MLTDNHAGRLPECHDQHGCRRGDVEWPGARESDLATVET